MKISNNPGFTKRMETGVIKKKTVEQKTFLNVADSVGSVVDTDGGYAKPVIQQKGSKEAAVSKLMADLKNTYEIDDENGEKLCGIITESAKKTGTDLKEYGKLMKLMPSGARHFSIALKLLNDSVAGETFKERREILKELRNMRTGCEGSEYLKDAFHDEMTIKDFYYIKKFRLKGEGLDKAAQRFMLFFDKMGGAKEPLDFHDKFKEVSETISETGVGKEADGAIRRIFSEGGEVEDMKVMLKRSLKTVEMFEPVEKSDKKIIQKDNSVIIGGIRLERNRVDD